MSSQNVNLEPKYEFSRNDLDVIKLYSNGKELSEIAKKSLLLLSCVFGGLHNTPSLKKFDWQNKYWTEITTSTPLSTFDSDLLTRFVILAHDLAVRVEITSHNKQILSIQFHQRQREGDFMQRHPTIETAIEKFRQKYSSEDLSVQKERM